jgi:hypothetical protein
MTGYHIEIGHNSVHSKNEVADKLREVVKAICAKPETILAEVKRVEGRDVAESYAESYREPWQDATIKIIEATEDRPMQVMQLASGGGEFRDCKDREIMKDNQSPCPNCKEAVEICACLRNKCHICKEPVGNITFTVCDKCWDKEYNKNIENQIMDKNNEIICKNYVGGRRCRLFVPAAWLKRN